MQLSIIALACCLVGCALARPQDGPQLQPQQEQRFLVDGGYNEDKSGKDFRIEAQVPVWTSENKRHEIDLVGKYQQHLGGPWGNSEPSWGLGGNYRFRF